MEQPRTITIDGVSHVVDQFSAGIQQAVLIYNKFQLQLQEEQLAVMKTQAALTHIGTQISDGVKAELDAKEAPSEA